MRPNLPEPGSGLGLVKAWPGHGTARSESRATASLDQPSTRCPQDGTGRDAGKAARSNTGNVRTKEPAM